ncbi:MAG: hypothetical protein ACPG7F_13585 [Aggregatilineales bacterium]
MRKHNFIAIVLSLFLIVPSVAAHGGDGITKWTLIIPAASLIGALILVGGMWRSQGSRLSMLNYAVAGLIVITGLMHIAIGIQAEDILLLANGVGYMVLGALRYMPLPTLDNVRQLTGFALVPYILVTIAGYFILHEGVDVLGLINKVIEVVLLAGLLLELMRFPVYQERQLQSV